MGGGHRGIRWTVNEDNLLCELIAANASPTLICAKLRRSPESIRMRILALKKRREKQTHHLPQSPAFSWGVESPSPIPIIPPRIILVSPGYSQGA